MSTGFIDREIDGYTFNFEQFNTTLALKTLTRLTKLIGEPLAIALGSSKPDPKGSILNRDADGDVLGKAMRALVERIDEKEVLDLFKLMTAEKVLCGEGKIIFDEFYRGKMGLCFKVFQTALEVQYGNFIGAVSGRSSVDIPPGGLKAM